MGSNKPAKCQYSSCMLPKNNNRYWVQFVYLILSILIMAISKKSLSFIAIIMFAVPIAIDFWFAELYSKFYHVIRVMFLIFNVILFVLAFGGLCGLFLDMGDRFCGKTSALIFSNVDINKKVVLYVLFVDLLAPVALAFGCPTSKSKEAVEVCNSQK